MTNTNSSNVVLDINNLVVGLGRKTDAHRIIDDLSLQVREGETLCLVGESGSGKSVTSLTVMGLLQKGTLVPSGGSVKLVGEELLTASDRRLRQLRATRMAMIFQEPMTALNPVVPVGRQIDEVLRAHTDLDARARRQKILAMMEHVILHAATTLSRQRISRDGPGFDSLDVRPIASFGCTAEFERCGFTASSAAPHARSPCARSTAASPSRSLPAAAGARYSAAPGRPRPIRSAP